MYHNLNNRIQGVMHSSVELSNSSGKYSRRLVTSLSKDSCFVPSTVALVREKTNICEIDRQIIHGRLILGVCKHLLDGTSMESKEIFAREVWIGLHGHYVRNSID